MNQAIMRTPPPQAIPMKATPPVVMLPRALAARSRRGHRINRYYVVVSPNRETLRLGKIGESRSSAPSLTIRICASC